jgi:enoyl-CoA hydratase
MTTTTETYRNLRIEARGAVTVLYVHRPDVLNALNRETLGEIDHAARRFVDDPAQGAMIVTGSGEKSFISGADINELAVLDPRGAEDISRFGQRVVDVLEQSPKPVIAAINGYAFGGGCELALACHMRFASENAVMGLPEVSLGIIPGYGGTQRLARIAGPGVAREWVLTGEMIGAEEAWRVGVVNRLFAPEELKEGTWKLAETILSRGPIALRLALETIRRGLNMSQQEGEIIESDMFGLASTTDDMRQRMQAFLDKAKKK